MAIHRTEYEPAPELHISLLKAAQLVGAASVAWVVLFAIVLVVL